MPVERRAAQVFPPGGYIYEEQEARRWTRAMLGARLGWTGWLLWQVQDRQAPITRRMAADLARVFGTSAEFWLNLQRAWDEAGPERREDR